MNTDLVRQAREMPTYELEKLKSWYETLAEHYDDNMDFSGYHAAKEKLEAVKAELARRG